MFTLENADRTPQPIMPQPFLTPLLGRGVNFGGRSFVVVIYLNPAVERRNSNGLTSHLLFLPFDVGAQT